MEDMSLNERGDAGGKVRSVLLHLQKFSTFFSLKLMLNFSRMETVNTALQKNQLYLQKATQMVDTLREDIKCLCAEGIQEFWENTTAAAHDLHLESPVVPRARKMPRRLEDGGAQPYSFQTPEAIYQQQYLEIVDTASTSLNCRFNLSAFKHMQDTENFVTGKGNCKNIMQFHGGVDETRLTLHRDM